ncbi:Uncharacterised protein [uncultured archaeon]|nr:Uncharacterised protein [uncultured archaeon]
MPPHENGDCKVIDDVQERKRIWEEAKANPTGVIVEACRKVDAVSKDVRATRRDMRKTRRSVRSIKTLIYTLHPEADPKRSFLDKMADHRLQIAGLLLTFVGAVLTAIGLIRAGVA